MIALIFYQGNVKNRPAPEYMFKIWHQFYKASGTTMEFKIFTDPSCSLKSLEGFPLIKLPSTPPYPKDSLPFGDWLRSELYPFVQQPLIYMDLDALILEPVDNTYFE